MDVHRCRFVPYPPSTINALAFSHPSSLTTSGKGPPTLRLAIGRSNGDIEIWNPQKGAWYQESILHGGKDRSIEGLAWTHDPEDSDKRGYKVPGKLRLFSIGYSTAVTEWDLASGRPLRHSAGNYGEIWCMAAQPKAPVATTVKSDPSDQSSAIVESQIQNIAVGCADGSIVLLSTADGDLQYAKALARTSKKKARVLSLTFQNRYTLVAGHADSTIRIYDVRGGQPVRNITLGAGPKGGPKEILVWSVKCLSDGNIVSGDSTGTVSFWDGKHHALLQRIKGHEADILDIAVSANGNSVFSGGMDRRTALYRRTGTGRPGEKIRWEKITHTRLHENDVKAMATFETKGISVLASGGLDTNPIVLPMQEFGREHHRTLSSLPQQPSLLSVPKRRLIVSWWDREVTVWAIGKDAGKETNRDAYRKKLVAKVALQGDESIASVDLTADGSLMVVSTMAETKLFRLRPNSGRLKVRKLELPSDVAKSGSKLVKFSPDTKWLLSIRTDDSIKISRCVEQGSFKTGSPILQKCISLKRLPREPISTAYQHGTLGIYNRSIRSAAFSSDSRIVAVGDNSGYLDTWVLEGYEDLTQTPNGDANHEESDSSSDDSDEDEEEQSLIIMGQRWIRNPAAFLVPKLRSAPLILSFRPSTISTTPLLANGNVAVHPTRHNPHPHSHDLPQGEDRLFVVTTENQMYEFNVLTGKMSDWSRRNPASSLPEKFRELRDLAKGLIWDVQRRHERIWLYGVSWLWMFDLSRDFSPEEDPNRISGDGGSSPVGLKRKHDDGPSDHHRHEDTGAGSKILDSELRTGLGRRIRRVKGANIDDEKWISLDREADAASDDEEDYVPMKASALISLRRGDNDNGDEERTGEGQTSNEDTRLMMRTDGVPYWCTLKYRPILGMVPLDSAIDADAADGGDEDGDGPGGIEVALVERPLWETDLPARYFGDQEWNA